MDDKVVLLLLFNNNILRTNLQGYEGCICNSDAASNLIKSSTKYFKEKTKALKVTYDDLDIIFKADYPKDSEELKLWEEVKKLNISDIDSIQPAIIKNIKLQLKDYFFAQAFDGDVYDRRKLEELYNVLSKLSNLDVDEDVVEDVWLENIDDCVDIYSSKNKEGIKFFDNRISDTLSSRSFDYGTLNVITAPPGNGKTMLILNQAVYVAGTGKHVLHLAIGDLTRRQIIIRLLAIITKQPMQSISMLNPEQFKKFLTSAKIKYATVFEHLHCKCILPNSLNGIELIKLIKEEQDKYDIHFDQVAVDYDGNIETSISSNKKSADKDKSMYYEGADIYNLFVQFAKQNETVIWMLSQPKIQFWGVEKIPLEGLNDSSKKQHICDFIMSLGKKIPDEPKVTYYISKNRHGECNKSFFANMNGSNQTFEPITDWG